MANRKTTFLKMPDGNTYDFRQDLIYTSTVPEDTPNIYTGGTLTPDDGDLSKIYEVTEPKQMRDKLTVTSNTYDPVNPTVAFINIDATALPVALEDDDDIVLTFNYNGTTVTDTFNKNGDDYVSSSGHIVWANATPDKLKITNSASLDTFEKQLFDAAVADLRPLKASCEYLSNTELSRYFYSVALANDGVTLEWVPVGNPDGGGSGGELIDPGHNHDLTETLQPLGFSSETSEQNIDIEVTTMVPDSTDNGVRYDGFEPAQDRTMILHGVSVSSAGSIATILVDATEILTDADTCTMTFSYDTGDYNDSFSMNDDGDFISTGGQVVWNKNAFTSFTITDNTMLNTFDQAIYDATVGGKVPTSIEIEYSVEAQTSLDMNTCDFTYNANTHTLKLGYKPVSLTKQTTVTGITTTVSTTTGKVQFPRGLAFGTLLEATGADKDLYKGGYLYEYELDADDNPVIEGGFYKAVLKADGTIKYIYGDIQSESEVDIIKEYVVEDNYTDITLG